MKKGREGEYHVRLSWQKGRNSYEARIRKGFPVKEPGSEAEFARAVCLVLETWILDCNGETAVDQSLKTQAWLGTGLTSCQRKEMIKKGPGNHRGAISTPSLSQAVGTREFTAILSSKLYMVLLIKFFI